MSYTALRLTQRVAAAERRVVAEGAETPDQLKDAASRDEAVRTHSKLASYR
ncbi:MAG TPA: hypothetical protein VFN79_13100 [Steroidobacteraceae bacterium]|nr:hypothetical protein [Steroidobacteraceae bacterium]